MAMSDYSLSDIAAVTEGGGGIGGRGGFGDGGWWILLLFILLGGWNGNRGGFGGNGGSAGGDMLYPWLNQAQLTTKGFADQNAVMALNGIQSGVQNLSTQLCNCCSDMQQTVNSGFAAAEASDNARQIANMQQAFAAQTAMAQGFNNVQSQFADCCCENRLGLANLNSTILSENCADRAALSDGVRDILTNQNANTQRILDQMCQDKIDEKNDEISQLRTQLQAQNLAASQLAQNGTIIDGIYNRLATCPVGTQPVYGSQPIFTCQNNGCGCNCN